MSRPASQPSADSAADSNRSSYNTIQPSPRSRMTYAGRMTLAFACTAIMTVLILVCVLAIVWTNQFQSYTRENMQRTAQGMAESLSQAYEASGGWTDESIETVREYAQTMDDVGVQLKDAAGDVLYDDARVAQIQTQGHGSMVFPGNDYPYVSADVILQDGTRVGTIQFWAISSDAFLTKTDSAFRTNSYGAIFTAGIVAIVLACVLGYFVSRALTKPIKRITSTASQIRNGDLSARTGLRGDDEMGRLGETFDDMATTLERDIKLEHRLTSDVAHELRTPLMAMQATVEAMQDGVLPADDEHLATVAIEVRRLSRLVDAMLKLSRMENGKTPLRIERCDVVALASGLVTYQAQLFSDNGLGLSFSNETGHDQLFAEIDPDLIREALVNLMSNALRYTPEGGKVNVSVAKSRSDVLISVQDTGMGIAKEDIPRVFSRFWRSDASRERVAGGLGVGLALTKEIVDRHNGTISVDSELGVGTKFTLSLPLEHRDARPQQNG
ncbi:MAG: ATP-binding protein [Atopobiaceae bacterium]